MKEQIWWACAGLGAAIGWMLWSLFRDDGGAPFGFVALCTLSAPGDLEKVKGTLRQHKIGFRLRTQSVPVDPASPLAHAQKTTPLTTIYVRDADLPRAQTLLGYLKSA